MENMETMENMGNNGKYGMENGFRDGFRMYLVTFTFNHKTMENMNSSLQCHEYKRREMLKQVEYQFYPTLIQTCRTATNEAIETEQLT
jgi:hypothetical protein